jgi:hypothetical protein
MWIKKNKKNEAIHEMGLTANKSIIRGVFNTFIK